MSSILNALKKIEGRNAQTSLPAWPYRIDNRDSMSRHMKRALHRQRILGGLILVLLAALAVKALFSHVASRPPTAQAPGKTATPATAPEAPPPVRTATVETAPVPAPAQAPAPVKPFRQRSTPAPTPDRSHSLQALVWAAAPEDRFVLIDGRIFREGDNVDGARVVSIAPDAVELTSGGTTWHLRHGRKN